MTPTKEHNGSKYSLVFGAILAVIGTAVIGIATKTLDTANRSEHRISVLEVNAEVTKQEIVNIKSRQDEIHLLLRQILDQVKK